MNVHPYLKAEQFRDPMFLKIRRQIARLRLRTADDPKLIAALHESIAVYDELLS